MLFSNQPWTLFSKFAPKNYFQSTQSTQSDRPNHQINQNSGFLCRYNINQSGSSQLFDQKQSSFSIVNKNYEEHQNYGHQLTHSQRPVSISFNDKPVENSCDHRNTKTRLRTFCKDCGIFQPKSGTMVYREQTYQEKMDNHPDEIYQIMLQKESRNHHYVQESKHLKYREHLIKWVCDFAPELKLYPDTIYIAVSYMDTIFAHSDIKEEMLEMITLCCVLVAAKFSEREELIPSIKQLYQLGGEAHSIELYQRAEKFVLEKLDWNLKTITPFQFIQFYLSKGCVFSSDLSVVRKVDSKLLRYVRKYAEFLLDLSLETYEFTAYKSHILACAAIAGARKAVGISPVWNNSLEELTQTSWDSIEGCFSALYKTFETKSPEAASKAQSCIDKAKKRVEIELNATYQGMSLETETQSPLKERQEVVSQPKNPKKRKCSSTEIHETKQVKLTDRWTLGQYWSNQEDYTSTNNVTQLQDETEDVRIELRLPKHIISNKKKVVKRNLIF